MASLVGSVPLMAGGRLAPRGGTRGSTRHWAAAARVGSIGEEHTSAPAFAAVVGRRRVQKQQPPVYIKYKMLILYSVFFQYFGKLAHGDGIGNLAA